jgi:hypothetical protein
MESASAGEPVVKAKVSIPRSRSRRLSEREVRAIRAAGPSTTLNELAFRHGVSPTTIWKVRTVRTHKKQAMADKRLQPMWGHQMRDEPWSEAPALIAHDAEPSHDDNERADLIASSLKNVFNS